MENKKQLKTSIIGLLLTFLPIFIYVITSFIADKYYHVFAGRVTYLTTDYYFSFSPSFILDLPYFLPPIIWAFTLWFCVKTEKDIQDHKSFLNYLMLVLIVLNSFFLLFSLWFIYSLYFVYL